MRLDLIVYRQTDVEEHELRVVLPDDSDWALDDYQKRHRPAQLRFAQVGRPEGAKVGLAVLQQSVGGAWVLFSLTSLSSAFMQATETEKAKWYHNCRKWWEKQLLALGLDATPHLRRAQHTSHEASVPSPRRFLQFPSLSSYAMVALVARWACESKGSKRKDEGKRKAWMTCLSSMIYTFLGPTSHMEWTIYLDPAVKFYCGLPLSGDNRIRLAVNEGHADTTPALHFGSALRLPYSTRDPCAWRS